MAVPPAERWELVVVDNRSQDGTEDAVAELARNSAVPVRYVYEPRIGVSVARNRGIAEARGDLIAFTDDDCLVDPQWAARIVEEFARDPSLTVLGGRVELYDPQDAAIAVRTGSARRELGGDAAAFESLIGANLAARRAVLQQVGGFDLQFGAGSGIVPTSEDTELLYRLLRLGGRVAYVPEILVHHHHGRRNDEMKLRRFEYAQGRGAVYAKHILRGDAVALRLARWEVTTLLRTLTGFRVSAEERAGAGAALRALARGALVFAFRGLRRPAPRQG